MLYWVMERFPRAGFWIILMGMVAVAVGLFWLKSWIFWSAQW